jgi:cobalt-zinc-cadmium efflux system outer membrane protein
MSLPRLLMLSSLFALSGCLWPVREKTDQVVHDLASRPYDVTPAETPPVMPGASEAATPTGGASKKTIALNLPPTDVQTVAFMQAERLPDKPPVTTKYDLKIPSAIPGSEATIVTFQKRDKDGKLVFDKDGRAVLMDEAEKREYIRKTYPELPPLPITPTPQPGPNGRPYVLTDLQRLAAEYSPTLRQAISDVRAAEGALVQAKTYNNPTVALSASPTNNNSNAGAQGGYVDQHLVMWGKRPLAVAAAQKSLENAELALRRARSDLSTNVRNAYFNLIVAVETVRVNQALARFTDEIYRVYTGYLTGKIAAAYEPAALRAQAYTTRLAYQQAISNYVYAWKQLVSALGLRQLPLTEVAGRVDRLIPFYDYDTVLAHVLARHTDVLTARNGVKIAQYNLKLAQITPLPDMDVQASVWKESTIAPYVIFYAAQVSFPIPIWDQNKGNIMSAQAALIRAVEESHRVEMALTTNLATNYANYQNYLNGLEYYRRFILPDQVRFYRGVFERRRVDPNAQYGDLVAAQQALATGVNSYLGILGQLWSGVVSVADLMQTDDLFQMAKPAELPELPALRDLPQWVCPHGRLGEMPPGQPKQACSPNVSAPIDQPAPKPTDLPTLKRLETLKQKPSDTTTPSVASKPVDPNGTPSANVSRSEGSPAPPTQLTDPLLEPPPEVHKRSSVAGGS